MNKLDKNIQNGKLKIGMLSFYYPHLGGSGIITSRLARHLAEDGHSVHFIGYDSDKNPEKMRSLGVQLHKVDRVDYPCLKNEPYVWTMASKAIQVAKKEGLDLLHANYALPHALSAYLAREGLAEDGVNLPYVVTGHGSDIHTNGAKEVVNPMLHLALKSADFLTYVSRDLQRIAEEDLGINKVSRVIPNFVDPNIFNPKDGSKFRKELGISKDDFVIGHVSNFAPVKRTMDFVDIASYIANKNSLYNVRFLMIGDGKDRFNLENSVKKRGFGDSFIFRGERGRDEVVDSYSAMDAVVLTSKHEGHSLTLLEAMACGKPTLGYDVGGIRENIKENSGFLIPYTDKAMMALRLLELKADKGLRDSMGMEGHKISLRDFSPEKIMNQYLDVFREVVGNGS